MLGVVLKLHAEPATISCVAMQVLTHDGATVRGIDDIMSKLTSIVELHKAFGMSYRAQYTDVTPWLKVNCNAPLGGSCDLTALCPVFSACSLLQHDLLHCASASGLLEGCWLWLS